MLLYATYAQWSYEPANQQATNQEQQANKNNAFTTTQATQQTNNNAIPPNTGGVLGLSDAIPTINKNNSVEDTVSPALRTDVIRNNVLELKVDEWEDTKSEPCTLRAGKILSPPADEPPIVAEGSRGKRRPPVLWEIICYGPAEGVRRSLT